MCSWKRCAVMIATGAMLCAAVGLIVMSGTLARGSDDYNDSDNQSQTQAGDQQQTDQITLQGSGQQASDKFTLAPGLSIFEVKHDGESNLIIRLLDKDGNEIDTVFNQIGAFEGDRGCAIKRGGECLFDVIADGNWTIGVRQPRPEQGETVPTTLQGTGHHTTPFVQLEKGLNVFKMKHTGESRFRVTLTDEDGQPVETLVNTLGAFDGSKPLNIENAGIYFLNVGADGDWTIDIE